MSVPIDAPEKIGQNLFSFSKHSNKILIVCEPPVIKGLIIKELKFH